MTFLPGDVQHHIQHFFQVTAIIAENEHKTQKNWQKSNNTRRNINRARSKIRKSRIHNSRLDEEMMWPMSQNRINESQTSLHKVWKRIMRLPGSQHRSPHLAKCLKKTTETPCDEISKKPKLLSLLSLLLSLSSCFFFFWFCILCFAFWLLCFLCFCVFVSSSFFRFFFALAILLFCFVCLFVFFLLLLSQLVARGLICLTTQPRRARHKHTWRAQSSKHYHNQTKHNQTKQKLQPLKQQTAKKHKQQTKKMKLFKSENGNQTTNRT